jgi:quinate dehydrogenase (quinone)
LIWGLLEVGLDFWALQSRVLLLMLLGCWLLSPWSRRALYEGAPPPLLSSIFTWVLVVSLVTTGSAFWTLATRAQPTESLPDLESGLVPVRPAGEWHHYGNDAGGSRFSPLSQINNDNVDQLKVAWTYRTKVGGTFKATPLQIGKHLYVCGGGNVVVALNAESGELVWQYDPEIDEEVLRNLRYFTTTCRGVTYYQAPADYQGECPQRILTATTDARLIALDAHTGKICPRFGDNGQVDLKYKLGEVKPFYYFVTSPPAIVRGNAVVGGWVFDNREVKEPSGVVRAFNAISGQFSWAWDMGRPGINTEPGEGEIYTRGTPNVWSIFSVDEQRGIVYAPTGNETPDYFGGYRLQASEKYASSVVAINGETGEPIWHFQTVHHDIWDWDVPSQPVLIDIPSDSGELLPALVQPTKRGELFVLNRVTGEPITEVRELPVPQGGVPEDWTSPTQPFSVGMSNFRTPDLREADMWGLTPFDQLWCRIEFKKLRNEGHFTPPSTEWTLQYPGNAGGFNWGSVSVDPINHYVIANPLNMANRTRLIPRAEMEAGARGSVQAGTPYGFSTERFMSPLDVPCQKPPYSWLAVIDLKTQTIKWKKPAGTTNEMGPLGLKFGLPLPMGVPISAGTITTQGGLVFMAGTMDRYIRAFDIHTGDELWRYHLPTNAQATPMTYMSSDSKRQFIVITTPAAGRAFGGETAGPDGEDPEGGYIIAFELEKQ